MAFKYLSEPIYELPILAGVRNEEFLRDRHREAYLLFDTRPL